LEVTEKDGVLRHQQERRWHVLFGGECVLPSALAEGDDLMKMTNAVALVCVGVVFGQGCALTTDTIRVGYRVTRAQPIAGAERTTLTVKMTDARGIGDRVSVKKNGYGMEMAPILDPQAIATIKSSLEAELRARGFTPGASATVNVEVVRFYNDFKIGLFSGDALADMEMNVQVKAPDGAILFAKSVKAAGANKGILLSGGDEAKVALEGALREGMDKLLADREFFDALIKAGQRPNAATAGVM